MKYVVDCPVAFMWVVRLVKNLQARFPFIVPLAVLP